MFPPGIMTIFASILCSMSVQHPSTENDLVGCRTYVLYSAWRMPAPASTYLGGGCCDPDGLRRDGTAAVVLLMVTLILEGRLDSTSEDAVRKLAAGRSHELGEDGEFVPYRDRRGSIDGRHTNLSGRLLVSIWGQHCMSSGRNGDAPRPRRGWRNAATRIHDGQIDDRGICTGHPRPQLLSGHDTLAGCQRPPLSHARELWPNRLLASPLSGCLRFRRRGNRLIHLASVDP
jgi:hypothetical protein